MTFAVDWALKTNCLQIYLSSFEEYSAVQKWINLPDMTFAVDWAVKTTYLSSTKMIKNGKQRWLLAFKETNQNTQEDKTEHFLIMD